MDYREVLKTLPPATNSENYMLVVRVTDYSGVRGGNIGGYYERDVYEDIEALCVAWFGKEYQVEKLEYTAPEGNDNYWYDIWYKDSEGNMVKLFCQPFELHLKKDYNLVGS